MVATFKASYTTRRGTIPENLEIRQALQVCDVLAPACEKVVHTENIMSGSDKTVAQVASDEAGTTGDKNTFLRHC